MAISNHRIKAFENGKVTFIYKDYKAEAALKSITLEANEFIRRFMQHILPCGFYKIRYFGFLALCNIKSKLEVCFDLIGKAGYFPVLEGLNALEIWHVISGKDPFCCPLCKTGKMFIRRKFLANSLKPG